MVVKLLEVAFAPRFSLHAARIEALVPVADGFEEGVSRPVGPRLAAFLPNIERAFVNVGDETWHGCS